MEQTNMVMAALQTMAIQNMVPKTGKSGGKAADDFQKLLDQKAQASTKSDAPVEEKLKTEAASAEKEEGPVLEEDSLEQVKKLAEQGYAIIQPTVAMVTADGQVYEPGEYVIAWKGTSVEFIPTTDLNDSQRQQLDSLLTDFGKVTDVSDPEADAMLEATDPNADHSPAKLLEQVVDEQAGKAVKQAVEEIQTETQPQTRQEDEEQVQVIDVEQGPQQLFHDVEAAPVKVGDIEMPQQAEETNVDGQIDAQLTQALQTGDTMVRIQLTPENLGEVTVEISQSADGALRIALSAHNADTRGLLERHAGDLQGMIATRANQNVEVSVQHPQESQQNQNQQHQQNYDGHNGHAQDGQERRQQRQQHTSPQDFMQQLRLGLIPDDGGI